MIKLDEATLKAEERFATTLKRGEKRTKTRSLATEFQKWSFSMATMEDPEEKTKVRDEREEQSEEEPKQAATRESTPTEDDSEKLAFLEKLIKVDLGPEQENKIVASDAMMDIFTLMYNEGNIVEEYQTHAIRLGLADAVV